MCVQQAASTRLCTAGSFYPFVVYTAFATVISCVFMILPLLVVDGLFGATLAIVGLVLVTSMMADIVEDVQAATGRRSEGLLFSADTMLKQIVTGIGSMGTGLILQFVHFPERAIPGHVPAEVLRHLALIYLPITAVTSGLAICMIAFYRIDRASHLSRLASIARAATSPEPSA